MINIKNPLYYLFIIIILIPNNTKNNYFKNIIK